MAEHISEGACSTKIVECSDCYKHFKHESNLKRIVERIHQRERFHCAVCEDSFLAFATSGSATIDNDDNDIETCMKCNQTFESKTSLKKHK